MQGLITSELPAAFQGKRLLQPVSYFQNKRNATDISEHYLHAVVEKLFCPAWFHLYTTAYHLISPALPEEVSFQTQGSPVSLTLQAYKPSL